MCSNNDYVIGCTRKESMFIAYVNKLRSKYGDLQHNVLIYLLRAITSTYIIFPNLFFAL